MHSWARGGGGGGGGVLDSPTLPPVCRLIFFPLHLGLAYCDSLPTDLQSDLWKGETDRRGGEGGGEGER